MNFGRGAISVCLLVVFAGGCASTPGPQETASREVATPMSTVPPAKPIPEVSAADVFPHRTDLPRDDSYTRIDSYQPPRPITQVPPQVGETLSPGTYQLILCFIIEADGSVREAKVVDSSENPSFDQACLDMIRKWRFSPAISGGKPIAVGTYLPVRTDLQDTH